MLPDIDSLYFHVSGPMPTNLILQFDGQQDEEHFAGLMAEFLQERKPSFSWFKGGAVHILTTLVDNFAPARIDSFLFARPASAEEAHRDVEIFMPDGRCIRIHLELMVVSYYTFNAAIFHIKATIPREFWHDKAILKHVRRFLQLINARSEGYNTDLEQVYGDIFARMNKAVNEAIDKLKPPVMKSHFLDLNLVHSSTEFTLGWSHATLILLTSRHTTQEAVDIYKDVLIGNAPGGLRDYTLTEDEFVYVESGDSIVVKPVFPEDNLKEVEQRLYADWLFWLGTEHYTWKVVWEIDRVLYVVLTTVTSHLRQKLDSPYQDIYELNGLLNYIRLLLDVLSPRNLTSNYRKIHFLEEVNMAWQTNDMRTAAEKKMDQLAVVVEQLNEIKAKRQRKRLEIILTGLSVISLGTLISNLMRLGTFTANWTDWQLLAVALGLPAVLAIFVTIYLLRN